MLATSDSKTYLFKCPNMSLISECAGNYKVGSLQYNTGIAALGASSQVRFYGKYFWYKQISNMKES